PTAFVAITTTLFVPLLLAVLGIVLRGSAFTFRHYGAPDTATQRRWGRVFSISSVATPWFLGVSLAAVTSGRITVEGHRFTGDFFSSWLGAFPALVGGFTLALFAFLAATYLTRETDDPALQEDFRRRALLAGLAVGAFAFAAAVAVGSEAPAFRARLFGAWWSWPLQVGTGAAALLALGALWRRRYLLARVAAIVQVSLLLVGWALSQHPLLIAPAITVKGAAAPPNTLVLLLVVSGIGALVLVPSLYLLLRVFKGAPAANGE
ncbi:MAG: cytochrome d ubiquinol oxidase subunit II, partial [Myxococcales bacterium]